MNIFPQLTQYKLIKIRNFQSPGWMEEWLLKLHSYLHSYWLLIAVEGGMATLLVEDGCWEVAHVLVNGHTPMCTWATLIELKGL